MPERPASVLTAVARAVDLLLCGVEPYEVEAITGLDVRIILESWDEYLDAPGDIDLEIATAYWMSKLPKRDRQRLEDEETG